MGLIYIATYPNLPAAEWAQSRLAEAGIASALDNGAVLLWFWHYGVAVGGVRLSIQFKDLERARRVLTPLSEHASRPPKHCEHCSEQLRLGWDVCWRCGWGADATEPATVESLPEEPPATDPSEAERDLEARWLGNQVWLAVAGIVIGFWLLYAYGLMDLLIWCFAIMTASVLFGGDRSSETMVDEIVAAESGDEADSWSSEQVERIAQRAWQSAMLGMLYWYPLLFYGMSWTIWLDPDRMHLTSRARRRRNGAILLLVIFVLLTFLGFVTLGVKMLGLLIIWLFAPLATTYGPVR